MIEISKVNKYFNRHKKNQIHVINNISLKMEDTGLVTLLGPSGSGKTTLLNVIGGLDKVQKGKIYINNKKINNVNLLKFFINPPLNLIISKNVKNILKKIFLK